MCMRLVVRDTLVEDDWFLNRYNFFYGAKRTIEMQPRRILISFLFEVSDLDSSELNVLNISHRAWQVTSITLTDFSLENNTYS